MPVGAVMLRLGAVWYAQCGQQQHVAAYITRNQQRCPIPSLSPFCNDLKPLSMAFAVRAGFSPFLCSGPSGGQYGLWLRKSTFDERKVRKINS